MFLNNQASNFWGLGFVNLVTFMGWGPCGVVYVLGKPSLAPAFVGGNPARDDIV